MESLYKEEFGVHRNKRSLRWYSEIVSERDQRRDLAIMTLWSYLTPLVRPQSDLQMIIFEQHAKFVGENTGSQQPRPRVDSAAK